MTTAIIPIEPAVSADEHPSLDTSRLARRFTNDGSEALEHHLARTCEKVLTETSKFVPRGKLEALVLGGGYGRGEGGVLKTENGDRPYNDLEFYVFLRGNHYWNERQFANVFSETGERLSPEAGLHVEFKVDSLAHFQKSPVTMFSYDLVSGHRVLAGTNPFTGCKHHLDAGTIPLSEATRLMMNRCSGLLFAREKLKCRNFTTEDADFVQRNIAKAQLAFGDVALTAFGQYHWSCRERHARLQRLASPEIPPWQDEVRRYHAIGVEFKLHPRPNIASRHELESRHKAITTFALKVWLWLESRRLDRPFKSARDYAFSGLNKFPETNPWRNCLLNLIKLGPSFAFKARCHHHPRETVANCLALMLWDSAGLGTDDRSQLRLPATTSGSLLETYKTIWCKVG